MADERDDTVVAWPHPGGPTRPLPEPLLRPCDWGLLNATRALETQLGTVEAYNRLVGAAERLYEKIQRGEAVAQNPIYAIRPRG